MDIKKLLNKIRLKKIGVKEAMKELKFFPYEDIGFAKIDHHRNLRRGVGEVIFCPGKTPQQILQIMKRLSDTANPVIATKATNRIYRLVKKEIPEAKFYKDARLIVIQKKKSHSKKGKVLVITGGTGDYAVAEEAAVTLEILGNRVKRLYDVGVAGLHRLLQNIKSIAEAKVIIVIAGMEGALASVVGGLTDKPVIAVPTSVGYGANLRGIAPLLTMLNSCAPGVVVVNINNGFGAGYFAHLINR